MSLDDADRSDGPVATADVVLVPQHSPSYHAVDRFNTDHTKTQIVSRADAHEAGYRPCPYCFDLEEVPSFD